MKALMSSFAILPLVIGCDPAHFGPLCEPCPGTIQVCSGQGLCQDGASGSGVCLCFPGWTGDDCSNSSLAATFTPGRSKVEPSQSAGAPRATPTLTPILPEETSGDIPRFAPGIVDIVFGLFATFIWGFALRLALSDKACCSPVEKVLAGSFLISGMVPALIQVSRLLPFAPQLSNSVALHSVCLALPLITTSMFFVSMHIHQDLVFVGLLRLRRSLGFCVVGLQLLLVVLCGVALAAGTQVQTAALAGVVVHALVILVTFLVGIYGWLHCIEETADLQSVLSFPILVINWLSSVFLIYTIQMGAFFSRATTWGEPVYRLFFVVTSLLIATISTPLGGMLEYRLARGPNSFPDET